MRFVYILAVILLFPVCTVAATIYVPNDYPTIQGAIDASANGDVIIVLPGTFYENIDFVGKAITVKSELGASTTMINGNETGSVVRFAGGEGQDSVLDGFTLRNGSGSVGPFGFLYGAAIYCDGASPTLTNNTIEDNGSVDCADVIFCNQSSPTIKDNKILENTGSGIACYDSSPMITGNTIANQSCDNRGGGIYCQSSSPEIRDNVIRDNTAYYQGGGIYCIGQSTPNIVSNTIVGNYGKRGGGGIFCDESSSPVIVDNFIAENESWTGSGGVECEAPSAPIVRKNNIFSNIGYFGGGIRCSSSEAEITDNVISQNHGSLSCGGIYCTNSSPTIRNNIISENSTLYDGGGIVCAGSASPTIANNIVRGNVALWGNGGGIICGDSSSPIITNTIVAGNFAEGFGGGILCVEQSTAQLTNVTVSGNSASFRGGGICCSTLTITNTIFSNNVAPDGPEISVGAMSSPATLTILYSLVEGGQSSCYVESGSILNWGSGMVDADPLFADSANDDFHLTWDSPCRDTGNNMAVTETTDFEGDPRIALGTVDMGADEYYYHLYHVGNVLPGSPIDLKVVGYPNAPVILMHGSGIQDPPLSTQHGDFWLNWPPLWQDNGTVPTDGIWTVSATVPPGWTSGSFHPLQALVGPWSGAWTRLTNLEMLIVE